MYNVDENTDIFEIKEMNINNEVSMMSHCVYLPQC